jgi:hypothetical protein
MVLKVFPLVGIIIIFILGAVLYKKSFSYNGGFKFSKDVTRRRITKTTEWFRKEFTNTQADYLLKQAGIKMPAFLYQLIRYTILMLWLAYMGYESLNKGINVNSLVIFWLLVFILTMPCKKLLKFKSPFYFVIEKISKRNREKSNIEIYRCLSQLKNIAISMSNKALSADYIIREITKYTKVTKPHFQRLLGFWYEGRQKEGQEYFSNAIGTEAAKSLVSVLAKLDYISPDKFISQIELYQNKVEEDRKTAVKKSREVQGDFVFMLALAAGISICLNFLAVVVGIDALTMLQKVAF